MPNAPVVEKNFSLDMPLPSDTSGIFLDVTKNTEYGGGPPKFSHLNPIAHQPQPHMIIE